MESSETNGKDWRLVEKAHLAGSCRSQREGLAVNGDRWACKEVEGKLANEWMKGSWSHTRKA